MVKKILKQLVPPLIWNFISRAIANKTYHPKWLSLSYVPMSGIRMFLDTTGAWQKKMIEGTYDTFLFDHIAKLNPEGKTIYDIGSHIGYHALYFACLVGKKGSVCAFEPNKNNYDRLVTHIEKNPEVSTILHPYNVALNDTTGLQTFVTHDNVESGRSTGGFLLHADTFWSKDVFLKKGFAEKQIQSFRIDDIFDSLSITKRPDIIKIDVEGAEYSVLLGAENTLRDYKPILFIEIHSITSMFNVLNFLQKRNYKVALINTENNGISYIEAIPTQ